MGSCVKWVDQKVLRCTVFADELKSHCESWAKQGRNQCSQWADQGSNQCAQWADEGSRHCCSWAPCSWACHAYYWVSKWVCKAYYWVSKWVCVAYYYVVEYVCVAVAWIIQAVCKVWSWITRPFCVLWGVVDCALRGAQHKPPAVPIDHVFVLMLEDRSFDHLLGFSGISGRDAQTGLLRSINGLTPDTDLAGSGKEDSSKWNWQVDPSHGKLHPQYPADYNLFWLKLAGDRLAMDGEPSHEFRNTMRQLCSTYDREAQQWTDPYTNFNINHVYPPIMNQGFVADYCLKLDGTPKPKIVPEAVMRCFAPSQVPVLVQLAREFAVCDSWHASIPGPTWPNRFFMMAGSSGGLDDSPNWWDYPTWELVDGYRFENGTIFDLMDDHCLKWKIYRGDDLPVSGALSGMRLDKTLGKVRSFDDFSSDVNDKDFDANFILIEPDYGHDIQHIDYQHLHDYGADNTCGTSMHALDDVRPGQRLIKQVYETIRNSPHWERSVLVVLFDEHGGWYDHVPPPGQAVPPGDLVDPTRNRNGFLFDQYGVRVPSIVISPLIPKGIVDGTLYDHTSVLATIEKLWGLPPLTKRDANANDFLHLLNLERARDDAPTALEFNPTLDWQGIVTSDIPCGGSNPLASVLGVVETGADSISASRVTTSSSPPSDWQVSRAQIALRHVWHTSGSKERIQWVKDFRAIRTVEDAERFLVRFREQVGVAGQGLTGTEAS
ncbi:MAG TPA: alkaline phosphatase family protein [Candidatus Angelobacter sp.]